MERGLICGLRYRAVFLLLVAMSTVCLVLQYGFNYASISQCITKRSPGYVATRVVERVYFELPNSPTPGRNSLKHATERGTATDVSRNISTQPPTQPPTTQPRCSAQKNVVFLKTHKTGSSTITNILNRYADWNNLTMLLPKEESFYSFNWPNKFRMSFAKDNHGKMPNILANHARYSRKSMNMLFPREKTAYVTILRQPIKQWESTFSYMSFPYILNIHKKKDPLEFFLANPPSYENIQRNSRRFPSLLLIKNPLFFDLGLDYKHYGNQTMIRRAIKTVENDFNLILMMEHFDESMVLLKRRLCWTTDDVVFFKTNERLNKNKRPALTPSQEDKIKTWNSADVALYDYFVDRFWREVEKEGPDFYDDLVELRERKKHYFRECIEREAVTEAYNSVYVKGYAMRNNLTGHLQLFCERMLKNELAYQDYFKDNYIEDINNLEGETIENFDQEMEEAEVEVEISDSWGTEGRSYVYGLPTKSPRPPPSKVTILKTRVQKQKDKTAAELIAKQKREAAKRKLAKKVKANLVSEEGSGAAKKSKASQKAASKKDLPSVKKALKLIDIEPSKWATVEKIDASQAVDNNKAEASLGLNGGSAKSPAKIVGKNSKITKNDIVNVEDDGKKDRTVFKAEVVDDRDSRLSKNVKKNEINLIRTPTTRERRPVPTKVPIRVTNPITLEERLTTLAKDMVDLDVTTPEGIPESYVTYGKRKEIGEPMKSANKTLKIDDQRRYDGKTRLKTKQKD